MSKTHIENDRENHREREKERECCKGVRWECCAVSRLTTCDRPAPSQSSYSADDCFYVETVTPFPASDFMKERIKFHEGMTIEIDLNNRLRCISVLKEMVSFFHIKECRLYSCGNVDGKTSAGWPRTSSGHVPYWIHANGTKLAEPYIKSHKRSYYGYFDMVCMVKRYMEMLEVVRMNYSYLL